ncbi:MAG: PleD family two-component system response regulator, partial [bacterium]
MMKLASILVVDDEAAFIQTLSEVLEKHEFKVDISNSGYEALQMLSINQYDLVILDLFMPLISGIET